MIVELGSKKKCKNLKKFGNVNGSSNSGGGNAVQSGHHGATTSNIGIPLTSGGASHHSPQNIGVAARTERLSPNGHIKIEHQYEHHPFITNNQSQVSNALKNVLELVFSQFSRICFWTIF